MDKREKRNSDTKALLKDIANTRWLFYCSEDKTVFMIPADSSLWPKELSLHRKLSLQKHDKVQIRNLATRTYHECSLIDKGTETYLKKVEAKGAQLISKMQETLLDLSVSFADENILPSLPSSVESEEDQRSDSTDDEIEEPVFKRANLSQPAPAFERSPIVLKDLPAPISSTPCSCGSSGNVGCFELKFFLLFQFVFTCFYFIILSYQFLHDSGLSTFYT